APFSIGGPTSGAIKGNAVIAGPVQFLACPGAGCVAVEFGGNSGLQNNYTQLNSNLQSRIPMLFPNGTPVSTLGAVLKVKEGLVKLNSGSACIGRQETGSGCGGGANAGCDIAQNTTPGTTGTAADCTTVLIKLQTGDTPDFGMGPVMTLPIQPSACARQGGDNSAGGCTLQIAAGRIIGMIPPPSGTAAPIRPDGEPINVYVHRLGSAPSTTPTMTTSPVDPPLAPNMYYRGQTIILADNPPGTLAFALANPLLSEPTTNQPWCSLGSYLCGYAYPANHFLAMLTTGDITTGSGGTKQILGSFFAANSALTAKFAITGGA